MNSLLWEKAAEFHGHKCPGLAIGYKVSLLAIKHLDIKDNIEDEDIQRELLKEGLNSLLNTERQQLDYNSVNLICSKMCREYLNYVRDNYKHLLRNEFEAIQNYFKQFDEEILEMVGDETEYLIFQTEEMIKNRKEKLKI